MNETQDQARPQALEAARPLPEPNQPTDLKPGSDPIVESRPGMAGYQELAQKASENAIASFMSPDRMKTSLRNRFGDRLTRDKIDLSDPQYSTVEGVKALNNHYIMEDVITDLNEYFKVLEQLNIDPGPYLDDLREMQTLEQVRDLFNRVETKVKEVRGSSR